MGTATALILVRRRTHLKESKQMRQLLCGLANNVLQRAGSAANLHNLCNQPSKAARHQHYAIDSKMPREPDAPRFPMKRSSYLPVFAECLACAVVH